MRGDLFAFSIGLIGQLRSPKTELKHHAGGLGAKIIPTVSRYGCTAGGLDWFVPFTASMTLVVIELFCPVA